MKIKSSLTIFFFLLFAVYSLLFLPACSKKKQQEMKRPPAPVTAESVARKSVPVQIHAIGNVEAYSTVSIKARVSGELTHVYFSEGQDVNKGALLFTIDPGPYKAAFESAKANLLRDTALSRKADEDTQRYTELYREQLVSKSQYDQIATNAEALRAVVEAGKASLENARLQLSYCSVYAPISGRTGGLLVDRGNLIRANDDRPMVVINQIQPVYVTFSVPEKYLPEIKKYMAAGKVVVAAYISREDKTPEHGVLTFIDNNVDAATGTIKIKGSFANKERHLWPGQFVTITITLSTIQDAIVVPTHAVQTGQQGQYVFVVKQGAAELRPVTAGITYEEMTVIEKGLSVDELVVTDGQMRLMPGAPVEIIKLQGSKGMEQNQKPEVPVKDKTK
ncbi:MAG: efflux RND transporter periplasmic adaptor subunit [Nitrospirae bacterium]|nr:MAG: efflux RND transporter periplasmic adaptor subunit [Nitrospirota bacterium]